MSNVKSKSTSIMAKLKNISKERQVAFQMILNEFLLERATWRILEDSELADALIFKGGFVGLKVYQSRRYTVDIDAVLHGRDLEVVAQRIQQTVEHDCADGTWFKYEASQDLQTTGEYGGLRLIFRGGVGEPLPSLQRAQRIHLDIGIGDPVFPEPLKIETPMMIDQRSLTWLVYPVETIISEKLHTLVDRGVGNSRSKDIYDLSYLLPKADKKNLKNALDGTFKYRRTELPDNFYNYLSNFDLTRLRIGWGQAVSSIRNPPTIEECWSIVLKVLKKFNI